MNSLTKVCASNANLSEVQALCKNFRKWIDFSPEELEFVCFKKTQRNFQARLPGIVEPLLQKVPPTLFLPVPVVKAHPTPTPTPLDIEFGSVSERKDVVVAEDSGFAPSLLLKTLEELKAENAIVRERLDNQDEMLKAQARTNTSIEGMLQAIISRLPPY